MFSRQGKFCGRASEILGPELRYSYDIRKRVGGDSLRLDVESGQVPRQFYDIVASLSERLEESGVSEHDVDDVLDKIERLIAKTLNRCEDDHDDSEAETDSEDEGEDGDKET